jgi:predicted alpha/beta superfamily hydrolase
LEIPVHMPNQSTLQDWSLTIGLRRYDETRRHGGWFTGLLLCLGIASCSSQYDPSLPADNLKTTNLKEARSMQNKDADFVQEKLKGMVAEKAPMPIDGTIVNYDDFPSELIRPRPVDVWLPEGYEPTSSDRYPVIYMHDGQFLFHQSSSPFAGMDFFWDVDKAMTRLIRSGEIRPAIVVSVWMSHWSKGARGAEYMPQKPVTDEVWQVMKAEGENFSVEEGGEEMSSDNYLKFLVDELKPFIDRTYATQSDPDNTFIMGSSMGGLISAYAIAEYPDVFGGAVCMSSHWPIADGIVVQWLANHWPSAGSHRVYFDYGTETLDARYEPYQQQMDEVMRKHGYTAEADWITLRFDGADHSPEAWRERLHVPLKFLLGTL